MVRSFLAAGVVCAVALFAACFVQADQSKGGPLSPPAPEASIAPTGGIGQRAPRWQDVPDVATQEILRRGNFVEHIRPNEGIRNDGQRGFAQIMAPPPDDSHKWYITVVTCRNCVHCDRLKADLANSPHLQAFVNVRDYKQSWAHYNVFAAEDQTQTWRWKNIRFSGYPTLLIQPPVNGEWGNPKTIVWQKNGYGGKPDQLANELRAALQRYVDNYAKRVGVPAEKLDTPNEPAPQGGMRQGGIGQEVEGPPPFEPPPSPNLTPNVPGPLPGPSPNSEWPPVSPHNPLTPSPDGTPEPSLMLIITLAIKLVAHFAGGGGLASAIQTIGALVAAVFAFLIHRKVQPAPAPVPTDPAPPATPSV